MVRSTTSDNVTLTCVNCGYVHTANNANCPVFRKETSNRRASTTARTLPLPTHRRPTQTRPARSWLPPTSHSDRVSADASALNALKRAKALFLPHHLLDRSLRHALLRPPQHSATSGQVVGFRILRLPGGPHLADRDCLQGISSLGSSDRYPPTAASTSTADVVRPRRLCIERQPTRVFDFYKLPQNRIAVADVHTLLDSPLPTILAGDFNTKHTAWNSNIARMADASMTTQTATVRIKKKGVAV
ncbi:unnamed protein product [Leptidea sinapis]|uniref:Endonuclease/exonuclease/phosphatase domain-containing protein n=1 Tax=Leptidea sinapis TaxID=189913 RepID=A0A5E4Q9K8_9NEOP|nr:unnamed protein product [Leptidea sinapis]